MDTSLFVLLLLSGLFWSSSALSRPYYYINQGMTWPDAQNYCRESFTDLATVDSMDDVNRLMDSVDAGYNGSVWIGLKRGTERHWFWSNGENTDYFSWASGMPNDDGYCVGTYRGSWTNIPCYEGRYFACYGNGTYIMVEKAISWTEAQSYCRQNYTDMPAVHSLNDNFQLTASVLDGWLIWIGLYEDCWIWSDQWDLRFRNWADNLPSSVAGSGDCVSMSTTNSGKWAHESCDLKQPFICYGDDKRRQIVRLQFSCNGQCTLNDASLQTAILNQINETLKSLGLESESTISWRKGEGEEVFHEEEKSVAYADDKCDVYN